MKTYWAITLGFSVAGGVISFGNYIEPTGTVVHLLLLVANIIATYISLNMLEGIKNADKDQETK